MAKKHLILSLDGGGIRGLLSALVVRELDRRTDFLRHVQLFSGTSTGGILALGLAGGVSIDKLVEMYRSNAAKIFQKMTLPFSDRIGLTAANLALRGAFKKTGLEAEGFDLERLVAVKYGNEGLREAVMSVFPTNPLLTGLSRKVMVTTFALDDPEAGWRPVRLHNLKDAVETHVLEAALCTSAAPTYFEPFRHAVLGHCIDGGVFANNPGGLAVSTAVANGAAVADILLLSVGTGGAVSRMPLRKMLLPTRLMGILPWVWPVANKELGTPEMPLLNAILDGSAAIDRVMCGELLGDRYRRSQPGLAAPIEMDDIESIPKLEEAARAHFATAEWNTTVAWAERAVKE